MEKDRFEIHENDFEVLETPCAKCIYNSKIVFGCEKYERVPALIRIGEEKCPFHKEKEINK